jgi:hypothetical protein
MRWEGNVACMGGQERRIEHFGKETEGSRPLGRPRHRRKDNIKMMLKKWNEKAQTRLLWIRIRTDGGHL